MGQICLKKLINNCLITYKNWVPLSIFALEIMITTSILSFVTWEFKSRLQLSGRFDAMCVAAEPTPLEAERAATDSTGDRGMEMMKKLRPSPICIQFSSTFLLTFHPSNQSVTFFDEFFLHSWISPSFCTF